MAGVYHSYIHSSLVVLNACSDIIHIAQFLMEGNIEGFGAKLAFNQNFPFANTSGLRYCPSIFPHQITLCNIVF